MRNIFLLHFILIFLGIISVSLKDYFQFYDILLFLILTFGLVLNYIKKKQVLELENISNYVFWFIMTMLIISIRSTNYLDFDYYFFTILISKILVLIFNYLKYKKIIITSTVISKIWIFSLFLYLCELALNSTHGLKNICFYMGLISTIESFIIIFRFKNWKPKRFFFTGNAND